jgi:serine/threonine-protein kinase
MAEPDDTQSKSRIQLPILALMANATRLSVVRDQAKPRKLGRYELEEYLGVEGGIETFRARVRGLAGFDRIFAVKCLRRGRSGQINLADPFIKTAKRTASVNDSRVARVLDADVIDGVAIAVTEFVHGLDLDRFREWAHVSGVLATGVDENADKWQKIVAYVGAEVAGGLAALHALTPPLVHGGLSPRNIIATARGSVKVLDVGLRQSARTSDEQASPRSLAYAAPELSSAEPNPKSDMRALGAVLFELATGELPPVGAGSLAARKILDALWPSMADFVAGLLAEDAALRPSAAEAAEILSDFWSEIPDASMVSEVAVMVRNFSGFVAESNVQHTPAPIPAEPGREESAPFAHVPQVPPPMPHASSASGSFLAAGDGPTRAMPSGSYASAIFQALPTDASIPSFAEGPLEAELLADAKPPSSDEAELVPATEPPAAVESTVVDPVPIPELAEWGARALAALGDQAGVSVLPLAPAPELASVAFVPDEAPPPPVNNPVIEEAFAFIPPPATPAQMEPSPKQNGPSAGEAPRSKHTLILPAAHQPLEDELIDDPHEPPALMANAVEPPVVPFEVLSVAPPGEVDGGEFGGGAGENSSLEATAFVAEEQTGATEWLAPRLAHAMATPEADAVRGPRTRTARRSETDLATSTQDDGRSQVGPSRVKRVAILIALGAGVVGAVAAALLTVGPIGKKSAPHAQPSLTSRKSNTVPPPSPTTVAPAKLAPSSAKVAAPAIVAPAPAAPSLAEVAAPSTAPAANKPVGGSSTIALPIASQPDGAMVWIDGEERGKTPCTVKLKPGSARLVLVHAGYLASQSAIEVSEGAKVDVVLKAAEPPMAGEARFRAECATQGKLPVVVNGKETGVLCPYSKMRVEPGTHTIGVFVPSTGKTHSKEITLSAGVRSINFGD